MTIKNPNFVAASPGAVKALSDCMELHAELACEDIRNIVRLLMNHTDEQLKEVALAAGFTFEEDESQDQEGE